MSNKSPFFRKKRNAPLTFRRRAYNLKEEDSDKNLKAKGRTMQFNSCMYKDYIIFANPHQHEGTDEWDIEIAINRAQNATAPMKKFHADGKFPDQKEALEFGFNYGRRIIDGKVEEASVADL